MINTFLYSYNKHFQYFCELKQRRPCGGGFGQPSNLAIFVLLKY